MLRIRGRLVLIVVALLAALTVVYIPAGQLAVRESYGGAATPIGPGLGFRLLFYQRVYRYDTQPEVIAEDLQVVTKDNASFQLPVKVSARVSPGDLLTFHRGSAGREQRVYIKEQVSDAVRQTVRGLPADEALMPDAGRGLSQAVSANLIGRGIADDGATIGRPAPRVVLNAVLDDLRRRFPASARRLAERSLASDPKEALYQTALGTVLEAEGKTSEAERAYLDALYLDPAAAEPMSRLYLMYQVTTDPQKILRLERLLEASLEKNRDSAVHNDWLGQVYMRMGRNDRAEQAFNTAIALSPKEPEFRVSLGSLKARTGKLDEARAAYEQALALRPNQPLALFNLGSLAAMKGDLDKAIDYFHQAEKAGPPNHALFNSLAQAYEAKGDLARAAEYLKGSLKIKKDQPDRQAALKRIEAKLKARR
ncbi:MAG TPA: tetratricopeptide repeat protein [Candidatus Polarisedimenticolia bacterium]|nr:tetratricopeptide repeat protein [Candidatus Polarisedimenticolia bacterium]